MQFTWDEVKNRANIRKHGFDLADAEEMFGGPLLVQPDTREDYGEDKVDRHWVCKGTSLLGCIRGTAGEHNPDHFTEEG